MSTFNKPSTLGAVPRDEEARARLAAIVESSFDAIVGKTLDWRDHILESERRATLPLSRLVSHRPVHFLIIPEERKAEEQDVLARLRRGRTDRALRDAASNQDGRYIPVSLTVSQSRTRAGA